jgi:hypothetical protein
MIDNLVLPGRMPQLQGLVRQMLAPDPGARPSAYNLVQQVLLTLPDQNDVPVLDHVYSCSAVHHPT